MDVFDFDEDDGQGVSSQTAEASVASSPTGRTEASPAQNATQQTKPAPKLSSPTKLSAAERIDNLKGMLDGVGQTASLGLRKQKAMELARACRASHFRALLRQRRQGSSEAPLLERVMEQIATAMANPVNDDETSACLCGAIYLLLKDRHNIVYIRRTLVGALIRLLKAAEEGESNAASSHGEEEGGGASAGRAKSRETKSSTPVKVPRFARKKFCGVGAGSGEGGRSAVWDELRRLLREADEEDESSAAEDEEAQEQPTSHVGATMGTLSLATIHRMLTDPQAAEDEDEGDGFDSDGFNNSRTPTFSRLRRRSSLGAETPMSENELDGGGGSMALDSVYSERGTDEHSDEGPGSIRWSLKEHMRMEGGLAVIVRVVHNAALHPSPTPITQRKLSLGLDLLETLAYLNTDNQRHLVSYRIPTSSTQGQKRREAETDMFDFEADDSQKRKAGAGGGGAGGKKTLLHVLLGLVKRGISKAQATGNDQGGSAARGEGEGPGSLPPDVHLAILRVLVNLTHHNLEAINQLLKYGGVELVLQGVLRHLLRSSPQRPSGSAGQLTGRDRGRGTAGRSGTSSSSSSFDAKILALNVLTNCVEVDAESRLRVGSLAVVLNQAEDAVVVSRLVKREDYDADGMGGGVVIKEEDGARSAEETLTPVLESLVQYLLLQIQPFADQLNQEMTGNAEDDDPSGPLDSADAFGDKHAEHLVLAAYTSLLLGCLMRDCSANRHEVLNALPDHSPRPIIRVLKAFLAFQKQVGVLTSMILDPIITLIQELESPSGVVTTTTAPSSITAPSPGSAPPVRPAPGVTAAPGGSPYAGPSRSPATAASPPISRPPLTSSPGKGKRRRPGEREEKEGEERPRRMYGGGGSTSVPGFSFKPALLPEAAELAASTPGLHKQIKREDLPTARRREEGGARSGAAAVLSTGASEKERAAESKLGTKASALSAKPREVEEKESSRKRPLSFIKPLARLDGLPVEKDEEEDVGEEEGGKSEGTRGGRLPKPPTPPRPTRRAATRGGEGTQAFSPQEVAGDPKPVGKGPVEGKRDPAPPPTAMDESPAHAVKEAGKGRKGGEKAGEDRGGVADGGGDRSARAGGSMATRRSSPVKASARAQASQAVAKTVPKDTSAASPQRESRQKAAGTGSSSSGARAPRTSGRPASPPSATLKRKATEREEAGTGKKQAVASSSATGSAPKMANGSGIGKDSKPSPATNRRRPQEQAEPPLAPRSSVVMPSARLAERHKRLVESMSPSAPPVGTSSGGGSSSKSPQRPAAAKPSASSAKPAAAPPAVKQQAQNGGGGGRGTGKGVTSLAGMKPPALKQVKLTSFISNKSNP